MIAKPLIIDLENMSWDALEMLETMQERAAAGQQMKIREMRDLVAAVFVDWTREDTGKITQGETKQIFDAIVQAFQEQAPPNENADS
jgi:hypothetical protein